MKEIKWRWFVVGVLQHVWLIWIGLCKRGVVSLLQLLQGHVLGLQVARVLLNRILLKAFRISKLTTISKLIGSVVHLFLQIVRVCPGTILGGEQLSLLVEEALARGDGHLVFVGGCLGHLLRVVVDEHLLQIRIQLWSVRMIIVHIYIIL